jgi:hypothetical protein
MGNSSSLLTQYDLEDLQNHCNNLCKSGESALLSPSLGEVLNGLHRFQ